MYTLKTIAQRSTLMGAAFALVAAAVLPGAVAFAAQALNPLTERSLLLSSSAPGWQDTDGSGYSVASPNPAAGGGVPGTYAPAGSGPNGKKTGQTFKFRVSSTDTIRGFTFQYCTFAAGKCGAPGNNAGNAATRDANDAAAGGWATQKSDLNVMAGFTEGTGAGQFQVLIGGVPSTGWSFSTANKEDADFSGNRTGKNNYITLVNDGAGLTDTPGGTTVQIVFRASESVYITNPGADEFFVKLNTYNSEDPTDHIPGEAANIDGGVTVANVMTDSIHITTKVLETMSFSVGTQNPDTINHPNQPENHGTCDAIIQKNNNRLQLGEFDGEYSLSVNKAYDVNSYWRLSSNSSGGATVYYSGNTLANTVGDEIRDMPTKAVSRPGTEQFGLGFVDAGTDTFSQSFLDAVADSSTSTKVPTSYPFITVAGQEATTNGAGEDFSQLSAQPVSADYRDATGRINKEGSDAPNAQFRFVKTSSTTPEPIAQQNQMVVSCATAKMRYVANIGADTPAGVYTTKVNYLAAPQY